jgi:hypothetical protein
MAKMNLSSTRHLPQLAETWYVAVHRLRTWIAPPDEEPRRPFILLIFNQNKRLIQTMDLLETSPAPEQVVEMLLAAMHQPPQGTREKPHRPRRLVFDDPDLVASIAPTIATLAIEVAEQEHLELLDDVVHDLEMHLRDGAPDMPGLLSVRGVTQELAAGVFSAAAEFHRAAPWAQLANVHVLAVRVPWEQKARCALVLGNGGVEYGLAVYRRWEDVERVFQVADHPWEMIPPEGGHSLLFSEITLLPFDDLEAIEQYGWEVANTMAYPLVMVYTPSGEVKRPSAADLRWYEAALLAIPPFVRDHLRPDKQGDFQPAEASMSVVTHSGSVDVHVKYPAGTLARELHTVRAADWTGLDDADWGEDFPAFDRRSMERMLAQMVTETGTEPIGDPAWHKAQELMYQAWEENNPGRRLILAHEALEVSPDCADAYVLLAEEEADTLGRALGYYQQGVAAAERVLGSEYLVENAGYFWGLLETRPYMRARQGLANTLWELGRTEEAMQHFQEMLQLNPNDNQGIRYSLLQLLLTMNRDTEAQELLGQYEDEGTAEWLYTRALLAFRVGGSDDKSAARLLRAALKQNPHAPAYLIGRRRVPPKLPAYVGWGDDSEAAVYASAYLSEWQRTPGATDWLQQHARPDAPRQAERRKRRRSSSRPKR